MWQCLRQFPLAFEFNEQLLLLLVSHSQSSEYGTFLFDGEEERSIHEVRKRTHSLWGFLCGPEQRRRLTNPLFRPSERAGGLIKPSFRPQSIEVWMGLFGRGTPYLDFHAEVSDLTLFLREKHDAMGVEADRQQAEIAALEAEVLAEERALAEELEGGAADS